MLQELKVLNGELSLKFDPLNTKYTVTMYNDDSKLDIEYKIANTDNIEIIGNDLKEDYNEIIISVYNETDTMNYYLYVYKENIDIVSNNIDYFSNIEMTKKVEISEYAAPIISCGCFIIILFFYTILFRKKKKNKM